MNRSEYTDLVSTVREAKVAYDLGDLTMADAEYDEAIAKVAAVESEHPDWVEGESITEVVETVPGNADIRHERPMLSLDKVHEDIDTMVTWMQGTGTSDFLVQSKYDGMAASALYVGGSLVHLATRGTGEVGEDITFATRQVQGLPRTIDFEGRLEVRGEIVMNESDFQAANALRAEHKGKPFVNKRNGTVGATRGAKDRDYDIPTRLFTYGSADGQGDEVPAERLRAMGFTEAEGISLSDTGDLRERLSDALSSIEGRRREGDVDLDGAVVKVADLSLRAQLGATGKHPRWALAYKFAPEEKSTHLLDVLWQVGRTGVITPRAVLDPVFVGGSTITYVTLHNPDEIGRMGIQIGDTVMVRRAGDVIPRIEGVLTSHRDGSETAIQTPQACPNCGGGIDRSEARWRCEQGVVCGMGRLIDYATGREAWDIEGVGGTIAGELAASDTVTSISDVLAMGLDDIASLPRRDSDGEQIISSKGVSSTVGTTVATKIVERMEAAKSLPLHRHLTALGMLSTGRTISKNLARHFGTLEALRAASIEGLMEVEKIGDVKATIIRAELDRLSDDLDTLVALGIETTEENPTDAGGDLPLAGMTVVATGSFDRWDRKSVQDAIEAAGGKVGSSVSKNTDLLIAGEKAGSKRAKAESLGVKIADEADFAALIGA